MSSVRVSPRLPCHLRRGGAGTGSNVRFDTPGVTLALNQYKAGIVSYLNVLIVQTAALASERNAVDLRSRRLAASVLLVRALGGGWDPASLPR